MKQCPKCSFANAERYPACVVCNTAIFDVESTSPEPDDPDYDRWALGLKRNEALDRQERSATVLYALGITGAAFYPGFVSTPWVLLIYFLGALVVGWAACRQWAGQFTSPFFQGILSLLVLVLCGPIHLFVFYMMAGHILLAIVLWHWIQSIRDMGL